jgi:predicted amidohydrolase
MYVGFCQFRPLFGKPEHNLARVLELLAKIEADLIVLPELPFSGYCFRDRAEAFSLSEVPRRSRITEALVDLCDRRRLRLVTGFLEREGDRCFNSSLILGPRGIVQTYRKIQLFRDEKSWFDPGDLPLRVRKVGGVRVGMMICFDWVFPEIARTLALQRMEVLAHPSNLVLPKFCQQAMLTRCLENSVFAVTANRHGTDRRPHATVRFTGRSQLVGPRGEVIFRAPAARDVVHVEKIDPALSRDKFLTPRNHLLRDRRPEYYFTR